MQQHREGTKKIGEVTVGSDRFGYLEKGAVTLDRCEVRGFRRAGPGHGFELSILTHYGSRWVTWRSRTETGSKSGPLCADLRCGFLLNKPTEKLASTRMRRKVQGKGLLRNAARATANCHPSTFRRLSDKRSVKEGERSQDFVAFSAKQAHFHLLAVGKTPFRPLTGPKFQ